MSKVNVIVKDKNTLVLTEDAKSGDYIDLTSLTVVDLSKVEEVINNNKDIVYNKKLNEYKYQLDKENELKLKELNNKHALEISSLKKDLELLNSSINLKVENEKIKLQQELNALKQNKELTINELNNKHLVEVNALKKDLESLNSSINLKVENEKIKLQQELDALKRNKELALKELELKYTSALDELKLQHLKEIEEKNQKIHEKEEAFVQLQRQRASLNVKQTGEDLEGWCNNEVISYMQNGLFNCTWEKDTTNVKDEGEAKASKADYIFKIYSDNSHNEIDLLTSVCLEMKDENPDSVNKKTNADYFKQLDKNRNKKNCKYALLVSNLENDKANDLPIYRVNNYPDMYVVRPAYMMIFLNLITSLTMRFVDLITLDRNEKIEIKSTLLLMDEFNVLKNRYLDKPIEQLKGNLDKISKESESIRKAANHIDDYIASITKSYLSQIEEKLNKFEINIIKEIQKNK